MNGTIASEQEFIVSVRERLLANRHAGLEVQRITAGAGACRAALERGLAAQQSVG